MIFIHGQIYVFNDCKKRANYRITSTQKTATQATQFITFSNEKQRKNKSEKIKIQFCQCFSMLHLKISANDADFQRIKPKNENQVIFT